MVLLKTSTTTTTTTTTTTSTNWTSTSGHSSSLALFCTRRRAATVATLLGRNGWACGFNSARCGRNLSHESSKGYKCWTARSKRDFPERNSAPLTIPSVPTMWFSTMPSGHLICPCPFLPLVSLLRLWWQVLFPGRLLGHDVSREDCVSIPLTNVATPPPCT